MFCYHKIGLLSVCFAAPESKRAFHYLFTVTLLVGAVTYYAQAANLGWTVIQEADQLGHGETRQIFYAKYINWTVSFPSIALALGLISGISWTTIICNIAITWLWILTYLAAAFTATDYKWGFFAFGTLSWVILAMSTMNESREEAVRRGIGRDYVILASWPNLLWLLYPIAFGLSDGGNRIGVTGSFIFFGILDILMVPVFCFVFVYVSSRWDWSKLNIDFSEYRGSGQYRHTFEKERPIAANTAIVD